MQAAMRITWVGHSTVLIELDGVRLLTDPVLRTRVAHLRRAHGRVDAAELGDLDVVLLSHLHYDHLDLPSLERLGHAVPIVVPTGAGMYLRGRAFSRVTEVDVGDEVAFGALTVRATAAEHDGSRNPLGVRAAALGYLVSGSASVYFAGDTDLFDGMRALAPGLDVALLPIAGWGPRVPAGHLDPHRAAEALRLLQPRLAVPIHWGTYRGIGLGRLGGLLRAPAESFAAFARTLAPETEVRVLPVGATLELSVPSLEAVGS